jgi:hypothetical protein
VIQQWKVLRGIRSNAQRTFFNFENLGNRQFLDVTALSHTRELMVTWHDKHRLGNQQFYLEVYGRVSPSCGVGNNFFPTEISVQENSNSFIGSAKRVR